MKRARTAVLTVLATLGLGGAFATAAPAAFHEIKISEVHNGNLLADDFVELQMYSAGQNQVATHHLRLFDAAGMAQGDYPIPTNLPNGESQRTFTIGNTAARDYNYGGANIDPSGAVCWNETGVSPFGGIDCVSWGLFVAGAEGLSSPAGTPAPTIGAGQSLVRRITPGCPTLLEAGDDTNNSAADFILGAVTPRNNSVTPTEKPCTNSKKKKCKKKKGKKGDAGAAAKKKKKCKKKKQKK